MSGYTYIVLAIVFAVLLFGTVFLGASMLLKEMNRQEKERALEPSRQALEMLEERYAKGEINRDEFERMKNDIERAFDERSEG